MDQNIKYKRRCNKAAVKIDIEISFDRYQYKRAERLNRSQSGIWHALKWLGVIYKNPKSARDLK
jgi:hypothetical protein